jgi:Recombination endonuclease VII
VTEFRRYEVDGTTYREDVCKGHARVPCRNKPRYKDTVYLYCCACRDHNHNTVNAYVDPEVVARRRADRVARMVEARAEARSVRAEELVTCTLCSKTIKRKDKGRQGYGYCRTCYKIYRTAFTHNITPERYVEMRSSQGGKCAMPHCQRTNLVIDHDHSCCAGARSCGRCVRGLICYACNAALGMAGDDPLLMGDWVRYVTSFSAVQSAS